MNASQHHFLKTARRLEPLLSEQDPDLIRDFPRTGIQNPETLALLLSPAASPLLESMAQAAKQLTRQHFGNVMQLYAPIYLSDHCINHCTYCGFRAGGGHRRSRLEPEAIRREGQYLSGIGYRSVLLLTGESPQYSGVDYMEQALGILGESFPMMGLEVYPLQTEEYSRLAQAGAESLSLYQETYDTELYSRIHPGGPKADFNWRLEGPERGCQGGMRTVNLGVLLGLGDWRRDVLALALHGRWLQRRYPEVQIGFSLPRMRPASEILYSPHQVSDRDFVQALLALRLWMPQADLTLSTREPAALRDGLAGLGITRMSAGSSTRVGGYTQSGDLTEDQFEISDGRSLAEMKQRLQKLGLEPVTQDWIPLRGGAAIG